MSTSDRKTISATNLAALMKECSMELERDVAPGDEDAASMASLAEAWTAWRITSHRKHFVEVGTFARPRDFWRVWRDLRISAAQASGFTWKACIVKDSCFPLNRFVYPHIEVALRSNSSDVFSEMWTRAAAAMVGERLPGVVAMAIHPSCFSIELHFEGSAVTGTIDEPLKSVLTRQMLQGINNAEMRWIVDGTESAMAALFANFEAPASTTTALGISLMDARPRATPEALLFKRLRCIRKKIRSGHQLLLRQFPPLNAMERAKMARLSSLMAELQLCEDEARSLDIFPNEREIAAAMDCSESGESFGHDDDGNEEAIGPDPAVCRETYRLWMRERVLAATARHREHMEVIVNKMQSCHM